MKVPVKLLLSAAFALAMPVSTHAQTPIDPSVAVRVESWPYKTKGTGYPYSGTAGGFLADFVIDAPVGTTFNDYLVWCIDPNRTISVPGGPYIYQAYTAQGFANASLGGSNLYDVTIGDMGKLVWLVSDLSSNWALYSTQERADRQGSIWATFRGETPALPNISSASTDGWLVLYNGANQTFLTRVADPAESGIVFVALGGFAAVLFMRRRRA